MCFPIRSEVLQSFQPAPPPKQCFSLIRPGAKHVLFFLQFRLQLGSAMYSSQFATPVVFKKEFLNRKLCFFPFSVVQALCISFYVL